MYVVGGGGRFAKTQVLSCCKWFLRYLRRFDQSRVETDGILIAQIYRTYLGRYAFVPTQEQPGGYI